MRVGFGFAAGLIVAAICAQPAMAEIGKSSAAPGEWWLGFNIGAAATWGPDHQAYLQFEDSGLDEINFDDGTVVTGGIELGYSLQEPGAFFDRIEFNLDLSATSRTENEPNADSLAIAIADTANQFSASLQAPNLVDISAEEDGTEVDARIAFKRTMTDTDSFFIVGSLEPFFRYQDTSSNAEGRLVVSSVDATFTRKDDIEASYYGVQAAAEFEHPMSEAMSLIGRVSAGIYYVDSDIETKILARIAPDPAGTLVVDDSDDTIGGRFGGAIGVKVPLYHTGAAFTIVATADYLTDVATIDHIDNDSSDDFTEAGFDDRLDIGGKVGLVFPLR